MLLKCRNGLQFFVWLEFGNEPIVEVFKKILCPVDMSKNSLLAVGLATRLSSQASAVLTFLYVEPPVLSTEPRVSQLLEQETAEHDYKQLEEIRPEDSSVRFEHEVRRGIPGPEIAKYAKENKFDLIVMSTHGRGGLLRLLMGSVAEYVVRHASCPVVTWKAPLVASTDVSEKPSLSITEVMRRAEPIRSFDSMGETIDSLNCDDLTAAPVVNGQGECIGILTTTDVEYFCDLRTRLEARDQTVLAKVFDVDEFGQRRTNDISFNQVQKHMTSPTFTISSKSTCRQARRLFDSQPRINHLVVVDGNHRPLGIIKPADVSGN